MIRIYLSYFGNLPFAWMAGENEKKENGKKEKGEKRIKRKVYFLFYCLDEEKIERERERERIFLFFFLLLSWREK